MRIEVLPLDYSARWKPLGTRRVETDRKVSRQNLGGTRQTCEKGQAGR
jgi:hypothetical protein